MDNVVIYLGIIVAGFLIGILSNIILKRNSLLKSFYIVSVAAINLIILSLILITSLLMRTNLSNTLILLSLLFLSIFFSFYINAYRNILSDINVSAFGLITIVILLLAISPFYISTDRNTSYLPSYVTNPKISTSPLFQDYIKILGNPYYYNVYRPNPILSRSLEIYSNMVYNLLGNFINQSLSIRNFSNYIYISLHSGNTSGAIQYYSELLETFDNLTIIKNNITYYASILGEYSDSLSFGQFLHILNKNYTAIKNIVNNYYIIMSFIYKLPKTSHVPVEIKITKLIIPFNKTVNITGFLISRSNYSINGTLFVKFLNTYKVVNLTNSRFSFPIRLTNYSNPIYITILFTGNNIFLPNITIFVVYTNVTFTKLFVKAIPYNPYVGGDVNIVGYVTGYNRTLVISLLNYTKTYIVGGNFSIKFPLPYNLTNTTYLLNFTVLPKSYLSPAVKYIVITPKLYYENLSVNVIDKWIIPFPLKITGKIYYNNTPLNNVKIFVFIGNSRYETISHNGYFSIEAKPKLSVIYGNQIIYVESDPQYAYYREVAEVHTTVYNFMMFIILPLISLFIVILLRKRSKANKLKQFKLKEIPIQGVKNEK